ncbi:hypothetical protein EJK15_52875 [Nonomuraea basaltis]|nr:hypothetical protein EJK15_52875 [Nonomuraea basaltis]
MRWAVLALSSEADPALVRRRERCPVRQDDGRWPPFQGPVLGPIIRALIEELGPACHVCHCTTGVYVEHNHDNLQVRGLRAATATPGWRPAPTPQAAPGATTSTTPPAAHLGLAYPRAAISRKPRRSGA